MKGEKEIGREGRGRQSQRETGINDVIGGDGGYFKNAIGRRHPWQTAHSSGPTSQMRSTLWDLQDHVTRNDLRYQWLDYCVSTAEQRPAVGSGYTATKKQNIVKQIKIERVKRVKEYIWSKQMER